MEVVGGLEDRVDVSIIFEGTLKCSGMSPVATCDAKVGEAVVTKIVEQP